ncbi:MAG: thioesterase family protein [Verrucomicrobia bacterium]|nr:thioesterase family protein [Verrucomicrobiota bacterium]
MSFFSKKRKRIYLRETDATGVLYFTELQRMALEAFEDQFDLKKMLAEENFLLPIVHVEADYKIPLRCGDEVEIFFTLTAGSTSSLKVHYQILLEEKVAGEVRIIHVTVAKETLTSIPLPEVLKELCAKA